MSNNRQELLNNSAAVGPQGGGRDGPSRFPKYPAYKDLGGEWIGDIPDHWSSNSLKRVFKIEGGSTPTPGEANWGGDIAWVTPADLSGLSSLFLGASKRTITPAGLTSCGTTLLPPGSLILSTRAPIGSLAIALISMCTNQGCKGLVPNADVSSNYFAYVLLTAKAELNNRGKGTTFLEISGDELGRFVVPTPPFPEQTHIARFLDHETARIDALIEEQQRLIELLKEKRQAVISLAVTKGLDPTVPMKDSGVEWLGEVPAHWQVRSISSISNKITNGYVGPTRDILVDEPGVRYLQSLHIKSNNIKFEVPYYVSEQWSAVHAKSILACGDVLIVQTGDIGQVAVVTEEYAGCNCHALIIVSPVREVVIGEWMSWVLNSTYGYHSLLSIQTGAMHPHLNCGNVKFLNLPIPPLEEQARIVSFIESGELEMDSLMSETKRSLLLLQERRSALISAAVTGKIDVRGWQPPADTGSASTRGVG